MCRGGFDAFRARLTSQFPYEARGIDRYVRAIQALYGLQDLAAGGFRHGLATLWNARTALLYANRTVAAFLDTCTHDPRLRAVLTAQSGDYAEPPSRASFMIHGIVTGGYLKGAYYPVGGGQTISDRLVKSIERHGGRILLEAPVSRIVIEHGRAVGVELDSLHLGRQTIRGSAIVSDADLKHTFLDLVGLKHLQSKTVRLVRGYEMAPALGVVYLGVRRDLQAEGVPNTNFFIHPTYDQEPLYAEARAGRFHPEPGCFCSSSSLKDPSNLRAAPPGHSNIELVTVVPSQPEAWGTNQ